MSKASYKTKKGESSSQYRQCVPPCPRFITSGDTHSLCVDTESALEGAGCPHCERLPLRTLRSWRALFEEGVFASVLTVLAPLPLRRSGSCIRGARSWIWQREWRRADPYLYPHLPDPLPVLWDRKPVLRFLPLRGQAQRFAYLSPRRKMWRVLTIRPFNPPQYEELLEVVTRAIAKLNIDWPVDNQTEKQRSKLDERFLHSKSLPLRQSLPFFTDLHTEVSRLWRNPFSSRLFIPASDYYGNVAGLSECGYRAMPRVEQMLAGYLSPGAASSLKAPVLPTKPLRVSSALWARGTRQQVRLAHVFTRCMCYKHIKPTC